MEDKTFKSILKLYIPNYDDCLTPMTICYLHDLYKMSRITQNSEEKKRYLDVWNNTIYNIQKFFGFYQDPIEYETEKILIKSCQIQR